MTARKAPAAAPKEPPTDPLLSAPLAAPAPEVVENTEQLAPYKAKLQEAINNNRALDAALKAAQAAVKDLQGQVTAAKAAATAAQQELLEEQKQTTAALNSRDELQQQLTAARARVTELEQRTTLTTDNAIALVVRLAREDVSFRDSLVELLIEKGVITSAQMKKSIETPTKDVVIQPPKKSLFRREK